MHPVTFRKAMIEAYLAGAASIVNLVPMNILLRKKLEIGLTMNMDHKNLKNVIVVKKMMMNEMVCT